MFQMSFFEEQRPVHVREYVRRRFGHDEHVCEHWRSAPSR